MGLFDSLVAAATKGEGTPWGAPAQRGNLSNPWDTLTQGKGMPWGAGGEKGLSGFSDPITNFASDKGFMGNLTRTGDKALFEGEGTPWAEGGKKSTESFMDPITHMGYGTKSGLTDFTKSLNQGQMDMVGMGGEDPKAPDKPTLLTDPTQYKAPSYAEYNQAGQENINKGIARSRNNMAAGMQKHGALAGGDTGLGFSDIEQSGMDQRGGLANAISNMQLQNQYGQLNAANQGMIDKYNNDYGNYQNALNTKTANRDASMKALQTVGGLAGSLL